MSGLLSSLSGAMLVHYCNAKALADRKRQMQSCYLMVTGVESFVALRPRGSVGM